LIAETSRSVVDVATRTTSIGRGSVWRRWDPHIHAPGTILNDQFQGSDVWDEYLARIEEATPTVEALGVTDYWSLDLYEKLCCYKTAGRLPNVNLIFPNVEIRFGIGTSRGAPVNAHLLISPEDPDHLTQARRFLTMLSFKAHNETYRCTREDLIALGRAHDSSAGTDERALAVGTNQFKVTVRELTEVIKQSEWATNNILVAVVSAGADGTSGLSKDASLAALREEIERAADVVFSGNPSDHDFWLGKKALSLNELRDRYDGATPCLHGSDAHALADVCAPDLQRYTWIKGSATFEGLRQAVIEPETRVHVGKAAPEGALPYRVVESIELEGADWCTPARIELNQGLVGIIGARGSGKTALADLIATGAGSPECYQNERSFIRRAADHLTGLRIALAWGDGEKTTTDVPDTGDNPAEDPGVQYLSQQFVERLCSADGGLTDELLAEIERVIFEEHPDDQRVGAASFEELLAMRAGRSRLAQSRCREALARAAERMLNERRKQGELPALRARHKTDAKAIADDKKARRALIGRGAEGRTKRLEEIQAEFDRRELQLDAVSRRVQAIDRLRDFVTDTRDRKVDSELDDLMQSYADAGLSAADWLAFKRVFAGNVDEILDRLRNQSDQRRSKLIGKEVEDAMRGRPYLADDADLNKAPRDALVKETVRLRELIGLDAKRARQLKNLDRKIAQAETALTHLGEQIADAEKSSERIAALKEERKEEYGKVFDALLEEERQLTELYAPLAQTLESAEGALGKLTFEVRREVDIDGWAEAGEKLLDLRTAGPFRGHGSLRLAAREELLSAWKSGSSAEVSEAMAKFRDRHDTELMEHSPVPPSQRDRFWRWASAMANWLDDTSHIAVKYGIQYDGVDIEQLSPGTRGIVLLLLYLSVDRSDDRPLIIDQPEENLDPKSVFDELVHRFRETRLRRQLIVVTHNANLIVNTDADQVVVAAAGPHRRRDLPRITYVSGGLEDPDVRRHVCDILEGGEQAFTERARRLRVRLIRQP
jgi:energy-coupling factor transporter ATP-binding protein EcfA2